MPIPKIWEEYRNDWSEQDSSCDGTMPQILIGSDKAILFPKPVLGQDGNPVQTKMARLLQSVISGKYLVHGFEEPDHTVQLVNSDQLETPASVTRTGTLVPEDTRDKNQGSLGQEIEIEIEVVDEEDDIVMIASDDESGSEDYTSDMITAQIHSPGPVCNASVHFNNL